MLLALGRCRPPGTQGEISPLLVFSISLGCSPFLRLCLPLSEGLLAFPPLLARLAAGFFPLLAATLRISCPFSLPGIVASALGLLDFVPFPGFSFEGAPFGHGFCSFVQAAVPGPLP